MAIQGHKTFGLGAYRWGYRGPLAELDATRAEIDTTTAEDDVQKVDAGQWSCPISGTAFGDPTASQILSDYIAAATADIPFWAVFGTTAADKANLVLANTFAPVANAGVDADLRAVANVSANISSRRPFHDAQVLHFTQTAAGITGNTDGTAVQLGAVPAGSELIVAAIIPEWPSLHAAASAVLTLEHDDLSGFATPTTAVETTGTNPWTMTAGTAGYMVWTIDGDTTAITDTWWRATFTTIVQTVYPIVVGVITTKRW